MPAVIASSYTAIAISSLFLKILDWILLKLFGKNLSPGLHQFGFMKQSPTTMCSWVVSETINYFTNRNSPVYFHLLDLPKAFDSVEFVTLFKKLIGKIPLIFVRLLIFLYHNQSCLVRLNSSRSRIFSIENGVCQGVVASWNLYLSTSQVSMEATCGISLVTQLRGYKIRDFTPIFAQSNPTG